MSVEGKGGKEGMEKGPAFPRATERKTAPRPQSQARLKLLRARVVSTTSLVSMKTSLRSSSRASTPDPCQASTTFATRIRK